MAESGVSRHRLVVQYEGNGLSSNFPYRMFLYGGGEGHKKVSFSSLPQLIAQLELALPRSGIPASIQQRATSGGGVLFAASLLLTDLQLSKLGFSPQPGA